MVGTEGGRDAVVKGVKRASTSFSEAEIEVMNRIFAALLRGGGTSTLVQRAEAQAVCAKFILMKKRLVDAQEPPGAPETHGSP